MGLPWGGHVQRVPHVRSLMYSLLASKTKRLAPHNITLSAQWGQGFLKQKAGKYADGVFATEIKRMVDESECPRIAVYSNLTYEWQKVGSIR